MSHYVSHFKTNAHFLAFAVGLYALLGMLHASHRPVIALTPAFKSEAVKKVETVAADPMRDLSNRVKAQLQSWRTPYQLAFKENENGFQIEMSLVGLFQPGYDTLAQSEVERLSRIFESFKLQNQNVNVRIEVYTDPSPVLKRKAFFSDNLALTQARANTIGQMFVGFGFPADHLKAVGKGSEGSSINVPYADLAKQRRAIIFVSK